MRYVNKHRSVFVAVFLVSVFIELAAWGISDSISREGSRWANLALAQVDCFTKCRLQQIIDTYRDRAARALG